ncbi:MAG: CHAD domain-containing protein [Mycolicibacterium sp.]|uniref:CYTH and CHAD domain-containing protein n=1 Tax=Mycolicibacterium sp. TaxID=2320850 RepID=UPI003D14851D
MADQPRETSSHSETERKFEVVESTVTPSFDGLSSVTRVERTPSQHLDAVYFDTPGRDLARYRITLRRRTGGTDAGWHLKLPAGPDTRTELRAPLTDLPDAEFVVPEGLRDVVLAIVRDRPLNPVARISTARTVETLHGRGGSPIAEFCDDQVTASATGGDEQRWREWELELGPGGDTVLFDRLTHRLLDAGALPAGHGSKLARVLDANANPDENPERSADPVHRAVAEQFGELLQWDRAIRSDSYDSVHQMRVTTRKLRSLLHSAADSFGIAEDDWILGELRDLAGILGVARDAEVLAQRYEQALEELPEDLVRGPIRERLVAGARKRYQDGWRRSVAAMRSQRYFRMLDALEALVFAEAPPTPPGERAGHLTIDASYKRIRKAAKAARATTGDFDTSPDEALHRVRKRAKQLRYTAAATGATKVADRAKAIQTLLGDHQDSVVSRSHLGRQARSAHAAGEDTFTYGLLYQQESDLARRCTDQLDHALRKLHKAVRKA